MKNPWTQDLSQKEVKRLAIDRFLIFHPMISIIIGGDSGTIDPETLFWVSKNI